MTLGVKFKNPRSVLGWLGFPLSNAMLRVLTNALRLEDCTMGFH